MCEDIRAEVRKLLSELPVKQSEVAQMISEKKGYKVNPSELSNALSGLNTPKCRKVLTDALGILTQMKMQQLSLLDIAKNL